MAGCVVGRTGGEALEGKQEYLDEPNFTLAMEDETCHPAFATCRRHVASGKTMAKPLEGGLAHSNTLCAPLFP